MRTRCESTGIGEFAVSVAASAASISDVAVGDFSSVIGPAIEERQQPVRDISPRRNHRSRAGLSATPHRDFAAFDSEDGPDTHRRRRLLSGRGRKKEGRAETARHKRQRSSLTRPPQEFPPAEPEKPTFLPRDFQAMLLFCGKKNLASTFRRRQSSHPRLGFIYIFAQIEENVADIAVAVQPIGCLTFAAASVLEFPPSHKML